MNIHSFSRVTTTTTTTTTSSDGGVSPVRMMKDICAALTLLSWMADVRTSFFIVRILVGNKNGSTLRSVVACCLPACAKGLSVPVMENSGNGVFFFAFWLLFCVLCIWRVLVLLVSLLCTRLGLLWCASCWARPLGGSR